MESRAASPHVLGSLLYFFLFMARGCITPFLPLIWQSKGLTEHQIGVVSAIRPVIKFFVTPVVCAFADRHSIQQQVLYALLVLYAATRASVLFAGSLLAVMAVEISCSIPDSPIGSLIDSAIRKSFGSDGYGMLRLWGAVGYGIASLLGGYVSDSYGGSYTYVMVIFVANILLALGASTNVRVGREEIVKSTSTSTSTSTSSNSDDSDDNERHGDDQLFGDDVERMATGEVFGVGEEDATLQPRASGDIPAPQGNVKWVGRGSSPETSAIETGTLTTTTTTAAAAAVADNVLDSYNDDDDDDEEGEAQTHDTLLPRSVGPGSGRKGGAAADNEDGKSARLQRTSEQTEGGVLAVVRIMLATDENASFFMAVVLSGMGAGVIDTFLVIRLQELGGSHVLCGLARLIMCTAEVPFFYLSGPLIRKLGVRGVIILAQAAYLVRFIYYAMLREPWWVLPSEVLHGLTYAAMWAATTDYACRVAPAHLRTTIQGAVSGLHWGLGSGLGGMLGGILYAALGARRCFAVSAALPSTALLLLALPTARRWYRGIAACPGWQFARWRMRAGGVARAPGERMRYNGDSDEQASCELIAVTKGFLTTPSNLAVDYDGDGSDADRIDTTHHAGNDSNGMSKSRDDDLEGQRGHAPIL
ncbi:unnamed protein product [Scytosiphon promiscuus]